LGKNEYQLIISEKLSDLNYYKMKINKDYKKINELNDMIKKQNKINGSSNLFKKAKKIQHKIHKYMKKCKAIIKKIAKVVNKIIKFGNTKDFMFEKKIHVKKLYKLRNTIKKLRKKERRIHNLI
jgi:hypothetical protein